MSVVEGGLRGSAVAMLMLLAFFHLRDARRSRSARNRGLFLLSAAGYTVCSAPDFARLDMPFGFPLLVASLGVPALLWSSAAAVFYDKFEPSWRRGLAWVGLVVLGLWSIFDCQPPVATAYYAASLLFIGLAAWHALVRWRTELPDTERQFRAPITVAGTLYAATIVIADFVWPGSSVSAPFSLLNSIGLATITFSSAMCGLRIALESTSALPARPGGSIQLGMNSRQDKISLVFDEQEKALTEALRELMEEQKLYRQQGLSIGDLGTKLGTPEYRVRRLIHKRLGYRNFSRFINDYRLTEARGALADPTQARVPVLTIALDAGFQSLAPFNRAFKSATGMTPSEYRRHCQSRRGSDPQ
jgi:AraC-like DNA-binding protein